MISHRGHLHSYRQVFSQRRAPNPSAGAKGSAQEALSSGTQGETWRILGGWGSERVSGEKWERRWQEDVWQRKTTKEQTRERESERTYQPQSEMRGDEMEVFEMWKGNEK